MAAAAFLFDLDNTLYPGSLPVVARIDGRINAYLSERVGIAPSEVDGVRRRFWSEYGTTLAGLMVHHAVDPDDYLAYVHDVDLSDLLAADAILRATLEGLPGPRYVFTNGARAHAARVLALLGLDGAFTRVVALEDLGYVPKPETAAYRRALDLLGIAAADTWLIDDSLKNLPPAKRLGMRTVWVSTTTSETTIEHVDHVIAHAGEIENLLATILPR